MLLGSVVLFKRVLGLLNPTGDWAGFAMQLGQFSRAKIGVDPRGGEIGMTHELLDCEIAKAGFEPLPRGQVPEGMQRPGDERHTSARSQMAQAGSKRAGGTALLKLILEQCILIRAITCQLAQRRTGD